MMKHLAELHHFCINMIVKIPGRSSSFLYKHDSENIWQDFIVYTEMMKFCQVFWLSCLYRNDEVLSDILIIMFIQKWWSSARYCWLSCLYRNDEVLPGIHFCINMIVKIPGRASSFLFKHDSQNTWQNFIISV
jgi:hypothetical protein